MAKRIVLFALALALAPGCKKKATAADAAAAAPASPATPSAVGTGGGGSGAAPMGWTGVLSEEEFKKLHTLKEGAAPPLRGKDVEVGGARAYLSLPDKGKAPFPALVVIHEWWGLNDHIRHWSDRLAALGYAALAVDLFEGKVATTPDQAMKQVKGIDEKKALATLQAAHKFLAEDPRVAAKRRGSIGWCFGGGWSLQLALAAPDLDAAVIYYGRLVNDVERLKKIRAPILGIFGNRDKGIPPAVVDAFDKSLTAAGAKHEVLRFDADHAFANPSGAHYDERSASQAWERVRTFLADHLQKAP